MQDDFVYRSVETGAMKAMIDASKGRGRSLGDVKEFQLLTRGLSELGVYSAFLSMDVDGYQDLIRENMVAMQESQPTSTDLQIMASPLLPYRAVAIGMGNDGDGRYIAIVLVCADAEAAKQNVDRLLQRIEAPIFLSRSHPLLWRDLVDVPGVEVRTEQQVLLARLPYKEDVDARFWQFLVEGQPLLLHD